MHGHPQLPAPRSVAAMPKVKPKSSRRAPPSKDSDYDHEIILVDNGPATPLNRPTSNESEAGPAAAAAVPVSSHEQLVPPKSSSSAKRPQTRDVAKSSKSAKSAGAEAAETNNGADASSGPPPLVEVQGE